ncbi:MULTISPECIES: type IV secretory system conjugative DNA transfer family protein [unclassified Rhodococcus (in: high G+C Gram-positive bacteria)]|uniref:type IV secretory system conjugative DNA transfer family protein n=1 Tax=unclassified Rhodococcus (in: high G+C Gram-positive bacteria) TaxID=192944 RepID=UPI00092C56D6|nr:TraM recognition domain-containing protein [Rhodococcus sp. M8]OLL16038.1 conjugal transfer protein TraD [Rhodococcus sp. M8]QPG48494.1 TraM recognition domain-containing protein [Rhodococcus sp. M8]
MAQARRDRPRTSSGADEVFLTAFPVMVVVAYLPTIAYNTGGGQDPTWNPIGLLFALALGATSWPAGATIVLGVELVLLAVVAGAGWWALRRFGVLETLEGTRFEKRIDRLARTMVDPREVDEADPTYLAASTDRLAPAIPTTHPGYLGIPLGDTVVGGRTVRMTWEFVAIAFAGARMGKSAGFAIPAICHAPGAALVASNRGDVYSHTVGLRRQSGRVWVFDLQGVSTGNRQQRASFWFNPLRTVTDLPSAAAVCGYFISAATDAGARVDAYFDGNARDLFASYLLAAALAGGDIRHVVEWLTHTQSQIPPAVLEQYGYPELARTMRGKQAVNAKQRDGFYDMARRFLSPLDEPRYAEAVLPNRRVVIGTDAHGTVTVTPGRRVHELPEFISAEFVRRTDTMYAMSKDGPGSSSAISSALVGQILTGAEEYSEQQESERMPIPLTAVLDEAANICKLEDLPRWYSHFGGRGIILITFFQSPSQGEKVWGREAFKAMVDACSVIWYGGNVDDDGFLSGLVDAVGTHYVDTESRSRPAGFFSSSQASVSSSWQKETIFEKRDLRALPKTRALVTIGGSTPILVRKAFWGDSPFAEAIRQSTKDSKNRGLSEQKSLPVGSSDRPVADRPSPTTGDDTWPDHAPVAGEPAVESSRTAALFTSEFMSKE